MAEKTAVLAPMPRASVRMTAAERPGALRRKRKAARALARAASTRAEMWTSRSCCVTCSRPPKSMPGLPACLHRQSCPRLRTRASRASMWKATSRSRGSCACRACGGGIESHRIEILLADCFEHQPDGLRKAPPTCLFFGQLLSSFGARADRTWLRGHSPIRPIRPAASLASPADEVPDKASPAAPAATSLRDLPDAQGDAIAVNGTQGNDLEETCPGFPAKDRIYLWAWRLSMMFYI